MLDHQNRTVTVQGTGNATRKPDQIIVNFEMEAADEKYDRAMQLGSDRIGLIQKAAAAAGFAKEDLKTSNLRMDTEYESEYDEKGHYKNVFKGYVCRETLSLSFDFDMEKLGKLLTEIGNSASVPTLSVRFSVKNPKEVSRILLESAAEDARERAEILCAASGVKLGILQEIRYSFGASDFYSRSVMEEDCRAMGAMKACNFTADFTPEDIRVSDTAVFVWEIAE